uniref:hypothetical protein n=1 Tax=Escherichia coli TaxID=562 RepID=UPI000AD80CC6
MEFHESAICDFRANANSVKPQPIAVLFKTMGAWAVLCFAADDTDARMAIGQEMEMDPTNDEFIIYGAPSNYLLGTGAIFKRYWPARLKRAKPAIKLHLTISL